MNTKMVIQFQSHNELADLLTLLQEKVDSNPGWKSVMYAVKNARPLFELCEEEAKRYEEIAASISAADGRCTGTEFWNSINNMIAHDKELEFADALRSFGSKS